MDDDPGSGSDQSTLTIIRSTLGRGLALAVLARDIDVVGTPRDRMRAEAEEALRSALNLIGTLSPAVSQTERASLRADVDQLRWILEQSRRPTPGL